MPRSVAAEITIYDDETAVAIDYKIKEELKGIEAHFFGSETALISAPHALASATDAEVAKAAKATATGKDGERRKQRPPLRKSARDDSVLSLAENGRRESRKRNAKKEKDRERADFAHTIDFSSLRTTSTHTSMTATTSASAVTASSSRQTLAPELHRSDTTTTTTKPTRKGLRKGSLSRSLKIFQELFNGQDKDKEEATGPAVPPPTPASTSSSPVSLNASSPSATRAKNSPARTRRRNRMSLVPKDSSSPFATTSPTESPVSPRSDHKRGTPPPAIGDSSPMLSSQPSVPISGSPFSLSSSASLMTSRARDRIRDNDTSVVPSKGCLPPLPAEAIKLDAFADEAGKKALSGSVRRKTFALSLSSISAINFTNPIPRLNLIIGSFFEHIHIALFLVFVRFIGWLVSLVAARTNWSKPRRIRRGLLWRVYELPEENTRELVAGRMAAIVGHIIEVACINDDGTLKDQDRLHRFLLSYTQWLSPDQMFSLLLGRYGFSEECLNPKTKRYVSSLASAPSYSLTSCLDEDDEENHVLRRKIKAFLQEWIKIKHSTDFSTPLSKKVIILLNRAIREEKEEEKALVELSFQNGDDSDDVGFEIDGDDWHPSVKREEASGTPPQSRRQKKAALDRLDRFQDNMPSPYSPTSFSKKLSVKAGRNKLDARQFSKVSILALRSSKVAKQLSRIDFGLFQKVTPIEFDKLAFSKDRKEITSPNIKAMADRFNQVSYWVATEILKSPSARARQKTLQKFIAVASKLRKNGNFASFFAVGAGLNIHSVSRLKALWEDLPQKYQQAFDDMMVLLNNTRNYQNYRSLFTRRMKAVMANREARASLEQADASSMPGAAAQDSYPLIPYIGVFTRDFTFLDEGNANHTPVPSSSSPSSPSSPSLIEEPATKSSSLAGEEEGERGGEAEKLVNYEKMELWGGLLLVLKKLQGQTCNIEGDLVIDNYLANFSPLTDNNLYHTSSSILQLER